MPTVPTHAVAAVAIGTVFPRSRVPAAYWAYGAVCAMLPDADVIGFRLGVHYGDFLGHRGFTHSLSFAAVLALGVVLATRGGPGAGLRWLYLFLATASHGLLDACTDGGRGVALLAPFDNARYFFPFRPIVVSPIGVHDFLSSNVGPVLGSELQWVWLPSLILAAVGTVVTWRRP